MTKKTYITALKEIDAITVVCKKCRGEMRGPLDKLLPEYCPYCKERLLESELERFSSLQKAIIHLRESDRFDFQFQTELED